MKLTKKELSQKMLSAFQTKYNAADTVLNLEKASIKKKIETFHKLAPLADDEIEDELILFANKSYDRIFPQINLQYFKDTISEDVIEKSENGLLEEEEFVTYSQSTTEEIIKFAFNQTMKIMRKERRKNRSKKK